MTIRVCTCLVAWVVGGGTGQGGEDLKRGVIGYLSLDGTVSVVTPTGDDVLAEFTRPSQAFTDDLTHVWCHQPRYAPGRFGTGVLVEAGVASGQKLAFRNYLPPEAADFETGKRAAFRPFGGARVVLVKGTRVLGTVRPSVDKRLGTTGPVLEGRRALKVVCRAVGSGAATGPVASIIPGMYVLSLFARTHATGGNKHKLRLELVGKDDRVIGSGEVEVSNVWQRVEVNIANGHFTRDVKKQTPTEVGVRVLGTRAGQTFSVDGLVLELCGGYSYAGRTSASSWMPGHGYRASDRLGVDQLRYVLRGRCGSVAFWAQFRGREQRRRTLFELATGNRWRPDLQLVYLYGRRLVLHRHAPKRSEVAAAVKIEPGTWHHYAVTWEDKTATMFLDGKPVGVHKDMAIPARLEHVRLGCAGPNAASGAVIDEAVLYNRAIGPGEVSALAQRTEAMGGELASGVGIRPVRFLETIARTLEPQAWLCDVVNRTGKDLTGVLLTLSVGPQFRVQKRVQRVPAGGAQRARFEFVADLKMGTYPFEVTATAGSESLAVVRRQVEITRAPEPFDNLMVSPWGWNAARTDGLTFGGGDVEDAMRDGLYWSKMTHYVGYPRTVDGPDVGRMMDDLPWRANFDSPYMVEQVDRVGERMAAGFEPIASMRGVTLSSEYQWIFHHDFTPQRMAWVRKTFGFDLRPWRHPPKRGGVNAFQTPFGRLKPSVAKIKLPRDRIIPTTMPIYAYHRWFHGPKGPTESFLNQRLSEKIHARRPDILTIQEPILRRAAVRAFDRMSIGQEWFYYEDPLRAVMVQEQLNAMVRGTPLRMTGMPQFLFKRGGAAPYNAVATADMWHETVWLCALQPIRLFTYWNYNVVPRSDYKSVYSHCMTKAQIDTLFGTPTPTWKQAEAVLKDKPTLSRKLMPWTPELIATFRRFHNEEVGPLGALIPRWRNRARRVAMVWSFASQIFDGVRWPRATGLERSAMCSGVPFDVLYDMDFETDQDPLGTYQMVIVSRAVCLTRPTYDWLVKFARRGGTIVVDEATRVKLPGAVVLKETGTAKQFAERVRAKEEALLSRFGSMSGTGYAKGAAALAQPGALPHPAEPTFLAALGKAVKPEARSLTPNTWLNLLEAGGACYIGVVNDLRVRGPMYGHFGKVREMGVPQTARVVFDPKLGAVAYDVLHQKRVPVRACDGGAEMALALPGGGACVVMLLPRPIASVRVRAKAFDATWGDHTGREIRVQARLTDEQGGAVPGLVPVTVTVTGPDGTRSDFSCHRVFDRGRLRFRFPVSRNGPAGVWKIHVTERASGRTAETTVAL